MDLLAFIHVADPTKVKVVERQHAEGEVKLLDSTMGRVVSLLPVAPACAESELEASVDKLFDEGSSADQRNSVTGDTAAVTAKRTKRHQLLASSLLNVEAGVKVVATMPFVTSSVSATPEREDDNPTDMVTRANLRSIVITEAMITTATAGIPSAPILETSAKVNTLVHVFMFHDSDSVGTEKPDVAGPSHLSRKELSLGSREVDSEHLHDVFISRWKISNDALLDDLDTSREFVDHLAPPVLFSQIRDIDYEQLFTEFNVETAHQANLLKDKDDEVERLKAQLLLKEAEAAETIRLRSQVFAAEATGKIHADEIETLKQRNVAFETENNSLDGKNDGVVDQVHALEATCFGPRERLFGYKNLTDRLEEFQDAQLKVVNDKVAKLDAYPAEMACHLEEKFYPHLLTTISGRSHGVAINRAIEKEMQDGLAAGIDHGTEGRSLTDVAAYKPSAKADFNSALQELLEIAFSLLTAEPDIEQLKVPIHRSEDHVVLGETSLSFALSVSHSCVEHIRANIAAERLALLDVWTLLFEPLSVHNLIGEANTSTSVSAATVTTTTLSTTFAFTSSIPRLLSMTMRLYMRMVRKARRGCSGDAATIEFEKEDLDTTPKRDLLS
nr:hypothetical protein [Tanacetum cinerariifolium]